MKKSVAKTVVLDASAMLALIQDERGAEIVSSAMEDGSNVLVSSVNLCEVGTKLVREGGSPAKVLIGLEPFLDYAVDFDPEQAISAAQLYRVTKPYGLSLGDRACIALALSRNATIFTTDHAWTKLKLAARVELIRRT